MIFPRVAELASRDYSRLSCEGGGSRLWRDDYVMASQLFQRFAAHPLRVRAYIVSLLERGAARGTFKANYYGIQYLYRYTLNRDWALFSKKRSACRGRSGCPARSPTPRSAGCLAA